MEHSNKLLKQKNLRELEKISETNCLQFCRKMRTELCHHQCDFIKINAFSTGLQILETFPIPT